jgi:hypothetical protein
MDFKEIGWEEITWINLSQDMALVNTVINLWVP